MIEVAKGNILEAKAEALVNTVNCVGVMGRGIALQFRQAFPDNYKAYKAACNRGEVEVGKMFVFERPLLENSKYIINFPTKRHWRSSSEVEYIESGLEDLVNVILHNNISSIALPPLGCGLGGLDWAVVRPKIIEALSPIKNLDVILFEPTDHREPVSTIIRTKPPKMTPGRAVLLVLMKRYLAGLMDPFVSLLEIHKLMYFMQEAGEPLRLNFKAAKYGPYAENLRHVLIRLDGHFINGFGAGHDNPERSIEADEQALLQANEFISGNLELQNRLNLVQETIDGFETPIGMELLSTVHWVIKYSGAQNLEEITQNIHNWNERKKQLFTEKHISIAWKSLEQKGWLNLDTVDN